MKTRTTGSVPRPRLTPQPTRRPNRADGPDSKVGGIPAWSAFVPFYNLFLLTTEVARKDVIWVAVALVPVVGGVLISLEVAKMFGKSQNFGLGLGLLPFVFYPMLGTSDAEYDAAAETVRAKVW